MKTLSYVNFIISILFMACYAYQAVYLVAALLKKQKVFKAKKAAPLRCADCRAQ